jgi:hypothetical protein
VTDQPSTFRNASVGDRVQFQITRDSESQTRLASAVFIKTGDKLAVEESGAEIRQPEPDTIVDIQPTTEPPELSDSVSSWAQRAHEWLVIQELAPEPRKQLAYSALWGVCREKIVWPMRNEGRLKAGLRLLLDRHLIVEVTPRVYQITGNGCRRYQFDKN